MKVLTIVSILLSATASSRAVTELEWEIQFGWLSGWGSNPGIYMNSSGAIGLPRNWSGNNIQMCSEKLSDGDLRTIGEAISSVPRDIPPDSQLTFGDHCDDEREHFVLLTEQGSQRAFSYSTRQQCLFGMVPKWLTELIAELSKHVDRTQACV